MNESPASHSSVFETNDSLEAVIKANDICNRFGIDTIATGTAIAFAMECFENKLIDI
jgi:aldehyde:ferredoxin oxidoreductase